MVASTTSAELGAESPAVASLLTNGFVVTPPAAVATLLDLVARGWLRIEHAEHEVVLLTDRRGREGDQLTGYEQQVLNHVHKLTAGTLTGVSGAGVEIAGLRLSRRWWRRFTKSVVDRRSPPAPVAAALDPLGDRASDRHVRARRSLVVDLGAQRGGDRRRRLPRPAGDRRRRGDPHPARRLATVEAAPLTRPATDHGGAAAGRALAVRAGVDGAARGSKGRRRPPPTAPAGPSPTPPPSDSPNGPPTNCRSSRRMIGSRGATPLVSGTSSGCATRSVPATAGTRR